MLTKLSLFSGIGGDDLASEWAGIETICFVEIDKYCRQILKKHWPDIPIIEDVKDVTKEKIMAYASKRQDNQRERASVVIESRAGQSINSSATRGICRDRFGIDIISGGFPCQPHSVAGKRKGSGDERNLWPEFRRVIGEIKPRWVVAENVPGLFSSDAGWFFGEILADLASLGYSTGWCTFGAVDVGALHRRDRVFVVGYAQHVGWDATKITRSFIERGNGSKTGEKSTSELEGPSEQSKTLADTASQRSEAGISGQEQRQEGNTGEFINSGRMQRDTVTNFNWWAVEPNVGRVAHGVPHRVDRLKGLGNAVVPQQVYPIYKAIVEVESVMPLGV